MARAGGAAGPGAALTGVGEHGGLTALLVLGCVSLLLATGNCKSLSSELFQVVLGWHLFRIPMELQ